MEINKKTIYFVKDKIEDIGDLLGKIEIEDNKKMTQQQIERPIEIGYKGVLISDLKLDYNLVRGLNQYVGKISGVFDLPDALPISSRDWKSSKEYKTCIDAIYNLLEKVIEKETVDIVLQ